SSAARRCTVNSASSSRIRRLAAASSACSNVLSEPPRVSWRLGLLGTRPQGRRNLLIGRLELSGWDHPQFSVEAAVIEPLHILQRGKLHVLKSPPGATVANQLGFVQAVERLG